MNGLMQTFAYVEHYDFFDFHKMQGVQNEFHNHLNLKMIL